MSGAENLNSEKVELSLNTVNNLFNLAQRIVKHGLYCEAHDISLCGELKMTIKGTSRGKSCGITLELNEALAAFNAIDALGFVRPEEDSAYSSAETKPG